MSDPFAGSPEPFPLPPNIRALDYSEWGLDVDDVLADQRTAREIDRHSPPLDRRPLPEWLMEAAHTCPVIQAIMSYRFIYRTNRSDVLEMVAKAMWEQRNAFFRQCLKLSEMQPATILVMRSIDSVTRGGTGTK